MIVSNLNRVDDAVAQGQTVFIITTKNGHDRLCWDAADPEQVKEIAIAVSDWATVIGIDEGTDQAIVSVGRQHGIDIGDRFGLLAADEEDGKEPEAVLEVIELIDEDSAACRILESGEEPTLGSKLRPILNPDKTPCFGAS